MRLDTDLNMTNMKDQVISNMGQDVPQTSIFKKTVDTDNGNALFHLHVSLGCDGAVYDLRNVYKIFMVKGHMTPKPSHEMTAALYIPKVPDTNLSEEHRRHVFHALHWDRYLCVAATLSLPKQFRKNTYKEIGDAILADSFFRSR